MNIKLPSTHLAKIFIDITAKEKPNDPRYVRHKRRNSKYIHKEDTGLSSSESSSAISSDDDSFLLKEEKITMKKSAPQKKSKLKSKGNINFISPPIQTKNGKYLNNDSSSGIKNNVNDSIPEFIEHLPKWGGYFEKEGEKIKVINTCTIDNYLFAFWVLSQLIPFFTKSFKNHEHNLSILKIIEKIDLFHWDMARQIWYTEVMKMKITSKSTIDFYGTVENYFLKYMYDYQKHELIQKCSKNCLLNENLVISDDAKVLHFGKSKNNGIGIVNDLFNKCSQCKVSVTCEVRFKNNPTFLFIETTSHLKINELPKTTNIHGRTYKLLNAILYINNK